MTTRSEYKIAPPSRFLSLSVTLTFHIVLPCEINVVRGGASHESYTQAKVVSAMNRRATKTQVTDRLAKQIEAHQANPMSSHVNPDNQSALRRSETKSATGTVVIDAICARIKILSNIDSILALAKSPHEIKGALWQVGSRRVEFAAANEKITVCTEHLKKPGSRLTEHDRNAAREVAVSFVSGSKACSKTGRLFTDQDCVSYVYHRTLERTNYNKKMTKKKG
jgi:hypothetical protein